MAKRKKTTLTDEFWRKDAELRAEMKRMVALLERERVAARDASNR